MAFETVCFKDMYLCKESVFPPVHSYALLKRCEENPFIGKMEWCLESYEETEVMFLDLLFCPEIGSVYITDFYGFCARYLTSHNMYSLVRFYRPHTPKCYPFHCVLEKVRESLFTLTQLRPVMYNKGHFLANKKRMRSMLMSQVLALRSVVPNLCLTEIFNQLKPSWMNIDLQRRKSLKKWAILEGVIDTGHWEIYLESLFSRVRAYKAEHTMAERTSVRAQLMCLDLGEIF